MPVRLDSLRELTMVNAELGRLKKNESKKEIEDSVTKAIEKSLNDLNCSIQRIEQKISRLSLLLEGDGK